MYPSEPAEGKRRLHSVTSWRVRAIDQSRFVTGCVQFLRFGWLEAVSCLFPICLFAGLAISKYVDLPIARYDALLVYCSGSHSSSGRSGWRPGGRSR